MKTDVIWVVEDLFGLIVACLLIFYSLTHTLKGLLGALVQCAVSGLLLTLLLCGVASWNPAGKVHTKRSDFSYLDHHWPFHKIVLSNHMKMLYLWWRQILSLHLFLPPRFAFWWHMQRCDSVVAGVARLGFFPLHIKACLQCVLTAFSPGRLYGNLALSWTKLNCERLLFTKARMNAHQAEIQYAQFTFAQNMNEFMNNHSLNAFSHNTASRHYYASENNEW